MLFPSDFCYSFSKSVCFLNVVELKEKLVKLILEVMDYLIELKNSIFFQKLRVLSIAYQKFIIVNQCLFLKVHEHCLLSLGKK